MKFLLDIFLENGFKLVKGKHLDYSTNRGLTVLQYPPTFNKTTRKPNNMKVKVINKSENKLPKYETSGSAGMDVRSNKDYTLKPERRTVIQTGLYFEIPEGYEIQVRPRSGLAVKYGITVLNAPGTIDADYRGELGVILYNSGQSEFEIKKGDRVAQLVLAPVTRLEFEESTDLSDTERGAGGYGSTGNN